MISLEFYAEFIVKDSQIAVSTSRNRLGHNFLYLLGDDSYIGCFSAVINETVQTHAVVEMAE
jgi:hypothetical protein